MEARKFDAIIVGAGVGGLTLAFLLQRRGEKVLVVESSPIVGGAILSEEKGGFLLEHGPNSTYARKPLMDLIHALGLEPDVVYQQPLSANKYFARRESSCALRLQKLPTGFVEAISTPLLSTKEKLRILAEPFIRPTIAVDESVEAFISRRLGRGIAQNIVAPALSGIWAADIANLSTRSAMSKLWDWEQTHGSLFRGALKSSSGKSSKPRGRRAPMISFRRGMSQLTACLQSKLGPSAILSSARVFHIEDGQDSMRVRLATSSSDAEALLAKRVFLTTPARASSELLLNIAPDLAKDISSIPYSPLGLLHLAYPKRALGHSLDGFGLLVPPAYGFSLLGALFSSSVFPKRAPDGYHLLTCFVGGATNPSLADCTQADIRNRAIAELGELLSASARPEVINSTYLPSAIPNYPLRHFELQQKVDEFHIRTPRLRILANWLKGISVADRIDEATTLASTSAS